MTKTALLLLAQMEMHDGHDWLNSKKDAAGRLCCNNGDCLPVPHDQYTVKPDGSVIYDGRLFPKQNVFPTEDKKGRAFICIYRGESRCAFIPLGV